MLKSIDDFLCLLKGVKPAGDRKWMALCPAHNDKKRSLSIKEADGKILLKCFAGCELADILKPLGLEPKDLFLKGRREKPTERQIETIYHYVDENGKPFEVVRTRPKGFYQRHPDGKGGYINNLKGINPTLYHQDKLKQAIEAGKTIYYVEGEKDADRLRSLGLVATTNPMGAGKWRDAYAEALRSADLVPIPDNDGPGHDHANHVAASVHGVAKRIRLLELPSEYKDTSDWLDKGGDTEQLERLAAGCPDYEPPLDDSLPEVLVGNRQLRDISTDALRALYKANKPEQIFWRSRALSRISLDEKAMPFTEMLNESALRGCLARCCNFVKSSTNGNKIAVSPPLDMVRDVGNLGAWQFPPLLGITEAPVMRPDGTIVDRPGYDKQISLYYSPSPKLSVPPIPDKPTKADIKAAVELTLEPLYNFPFDCDASRANAVATMFTPILRPMIGGPVPLAIFDKPQAGTGASKLAEVISLISTGRAAAMMSAQKSDEEWNKIIMSLLLKGQLVATIDNIEQTVRAPSLSALLTAMTYQGRILGRNETVDLPNRTIWIATGNNIRLAGDLPRRCIWVRMDAKMARPWLRDPSAFKHPHLMEWVSDNRGTILAALLTIARAWVIGGKPEAQGLPYLGGYEDYCCVVGGVLSFMGIDGFLGNLDAMYDEADVDTPQWAGFLEVWHDIIGDKAITAAELVEWINDNGELRAALPDTIADIDEEIRRGKDNPLKNPTRCLGNALARKKGVRFPNGYSVIKTAKGKYGATWQVVTPENKSHQAKLAMQGDSGDSCLTTMQCKVKKDNNVYGGGAETRVTESPLASKMGDSAPSELPYPSHPCPKCNKDQWIMTPDGHYYCGNCRYLRPNPGEELRPCPCGSKDRWVTDDGQQLCMRCHPWPGGEE